MAAFGSQQKKNMKKGRNTSIVLHLLLLLICFLFSFSTEVKDPDPDKPYKVVVDFTFEQSSLSTYAHADEGKPRPINRNVEQVKPAQPTKVEIQKPQIEIPDPKPVEVPQTPTDPVVSTTTVDESPLEVEEVDEIEVEDPMPEDVPVKEEVPVKEPVVEPTKPSKPTKTSGSPSTTKGNGTNDKPASTTDGTGTGKGTKGKGPGKTKGTDSTEGRGKGKDGTGEYDGSGKGIFGRRVIKRNNKAIPMTKTGTISIKTCINRAGRVTYTEIIDDETTIRDRKLLKKTIQAAEGYLFEPDLTAPKEQCGKLIVNLKIPEVQGN